MCSNDISSNNTAIFSSVMPSIKQLCAQPKPEKELPPIDYTRALETAIQDKIGRTVKIKQNGAKSSITIGFSDNNDLETVLRLLCGDDFVNSL